jgi:hypothetical protein
MNLLLLSIAAVRPFQASLESLITTRTLCSSVQECVASGARARGVFAVGGVNGFSNEHFDSTVHFLEPLEHIHSNMSNLVAHVWHGMKDDMAALPEEVLLPCFV